jgi:preprotein translocase subunit SecG
MKTSKKIVSYFAVLILLFNINLTVYANATQEAAKSIVRVLSYTNEELSLGTGFAIGEAGSPVQYFATNNHVVELNYNEVYIVYSDNDPILADVEVYDTEKDLAVIKMSNPIDEMEPLSFVDTNNVSTTDTVHTLGFPAIYDIMDYEAGLALTANPEDVTIGTGTINKKDTIDNTIMYIHDATISEGNSGGPLVSSQGNVIGINTLLRGTDVIYSESVSIDELIDLLDNNSLPYNIKTEDSNNTSNESNTSNNSSSNSSSVFGSKTVIIFLAFVFFILTLVIFIIIIALIKNSKKQKFKNSGRNLYSNRKNNSVEDSLTPEQMLKNISNGSDDFNNTYSKTLVLNHNQNKKKIYLVGIEGQFKEHKIDITNKNLIIGRSKSKSNLVFPDDFSDISGVHCLIQYDANVDKVYLTDKSTNGTFLINGCKFEKDVQSELELDTEFYLSTEKNKFKIISN